MGKRSGSTRVKFLVAWALALAAKLWLVLALQPFGDEAFYLQESTRLAWAYSDLPGLTAWLIRVGTLVGGHDIVAARMPFLLLGALLPWLVVRIANRWFGEEAGWQAGLLATLMPLGGLMGVLALPDVPMLFAALLCLDAFAGLMREIRWPTLLQLAFGLAIGALAHYRFAPVVLAGAVGLLCAAQGRALLRSPRVWLAVAVGAAAWWPLVAWNLAHSAAGFEFQFVDRHPWAPQWIGAAWIPVQLLVVTPPLFVLLCVTLVEAWRCRHQGPAWPFLAGLSTVAVVGYLLLAFFADSERVSFHWPLAGWLALCCAAPVVMVRWPAWARTAVHASAALGLGLAFAYLALVAHPGGRAWLAGTPVYADNFSGWDEIAEEVSAQLATLPAGTGVVADNFMLGAQLSLALHRDDVRVLDHPLNRKHGRAVQLADWKLLATDRRSRPEGPVLLVVEDTARPLKQRLAGYVALCDWSGSLPPPRVLNVDHGRKRFLLFVLEGRERGCRVPALAWIDTPSPGDTVAGRLRVEGWAMKAGVGISRVDVTLDGAVAARAEHGLQRLDVLDYWGLPKDPAEAGVGFVADVDLSGRSAGTARLGLVIHGRDGSIEAWPSQVVRIAPQGSR